MDLQLSTIIDTSNPENIFIYIKDIFCSHYDLKYFRKVRKTYAIVRSLFKGRFPGYKACNTEYHNLTHTVDALLASARLLDGYSIRYGALPVGIAVNLFQAALLHDSGYIQKKRDTGTGAKYTSNHVERSIDFMTKHAKEFGFKRNDIASISRIIKSTGVTIKMASIPFKSDEEKLCGAILGTADLLGQMSDREYLEKLLFLYYEFKEGGIQGFEFEFDILKKTLGFYEVIKTRFENEYMNVYKYAKDHFHKRHAVNRNLYMEAIDRHISYLKKIVQDSSVNFRHKLRRKDLEKIEKKYIKRFR